MRFCAQGLNTLEAAKGDFVIAEIINRQKVNYIFECEA